MLLSKLKKGTNPKRTLAVNADSLYDFHQMKDQFNTIFVKMWKLTMNDIAKKLPLTE